VADQVELELQRGLATRRVTREPPDPKPICPACGDDLPVRGEGEAAPVRAHTAPLRDVVERRHAPQSQATRVESCEDRAIRAEIGQGGAGKIEGGVNNPPGGGIAEGERPTPTTRGDRQVSPIAAEDQPLDRRPVPVQNPPLAGGGEAPRKNGTAADREEALP